jgi:ribonuclease T2
MHGLWPSRIGSAANSYPCQCDERPFDKSQLASIQDQVNKYWPSFKGDDGFWEHEWTKHGTCAADVTALKDELGFFKQTLALRQSHDIGAALKNASIVPDNNKQYTADQVTQALTTIDGFKPLLGCLAKGDVQYLHEVSFCVDKALKDVNCDNSIRVLPHDEVSDCDLSKPMVLIEPATQSNVIV